MRALTWQGTGKVSVETVPDPKIQEPTDAIVRMTSTAICGSDVDDLATHRLPLEEAPRAYEMCKNKEDGCIKVVLRP
jgi:threonine dehydrogenase-like Zn-dependent dehydrogenase